MEGKSVLQEPNSHLSMVWMYPSLRAFLEAPVDFPHLLTFFNFLAFVVFLFACADCDLNLDQTTSSKKAKRNDGFAAQILCAT